MDNNANQEILNALCRIATALEAIAKKADSTFQTLTDKVNQDPWQRVAVVP